MSQALADRTLYHLAASGTDTDWVPLVASVMDGLERGWVHDAHLSRDGGITRVAWRATPTGERALRAFRERFRRQVIEELGDAAD